MRTYVIYKRRWIPFLFILLLWPLLYGMLLYLGPPPLPNEESMLLDVNQEALLPKDHRKAIDYKDIPTIIMDGTIAVEDRRFFSHKGLDGKAIWRAIIANIRAGRKKEGASTITQQLAKNLYLSNEKTFTRKFKEAIYAIRLEMFYDKEELLRTYVNTLYYGHGIYGIKEASQFFFQKDLDELSLAEVALLIGIPKGPSYYSPLNNEQEALKRRETVLAQLLAEKVITEKEYMHAKTDPFTFQQGKDPYTNNHYFIEAAWAEAAMLLQLTMSDIKQKGYTIQTTYDPTVQLAIEQAVTNEVDMDHYMEVAVISMRAKDGAILGMVGGKDFHTSPFNRALHAKRMVGSTFKPFLYYAALENDFTAATLLRSEPYTVKLDRTELYKPQNFQNKYANAPITLAQALAVSDNIYAIKTQEIIGVEQVIKTARDFGLEQTMDATPSLALGTAAIPLVEMVTAYSHIANGGKQVHPHMIQSIKDQEGRILYQHELKEVQLFSKEKVFILHQLMRGMFQPSLSSYANVTGTNMLAKLKHTYAGKSGTTDFDHWMIGFTPSLVTGVWTGYDDHTKITKPQDSIVAKKVWGTVMEEITNTEITKELKQPQSVIAVEIDRDSGLAATEECVHTITLYFEEGTEPTAVCHLHDYQEEKQIKQQSLIKRVLRWLQKIIPFT